MQLIKMSGPECMLYSAAMLLDETPEQLAYEIGKSLGVHIQEVAHCAFMRGIMLGCYQAIPVASIGDDNIVLNTICGLQPEKRMQLYLRGRSGILCGINRLGRPHAVAFEGPLVYDPIGCNYPVDDFIYSEAWVAQRMR